MDINFLLCFPAQVLMKYGRQRWKLRGQMEINGKQVWDGEKMLFVPLIGEFLTVKVSVWVMLCHL